MLVLARDLIQIICFRVVEDTEILQYPVHEAWVVVNDISYQKQKADNITVTQANMLTLLFRNVFPEIKHKLKTQWLA